VPRCARRENPEPDFVDLSGCGAHFILKLSVFDTEQITLRGKTCTNSAFNFPKGSDEAAKA